MTDKQIIVDGIDVSGCECYSEHREGYCGWHIPCEGDICPYKLKWALQQLQAKEQECEELKKEQAEIKKYLGISHKTILERLKELTEFRDRDRDEYYNSSKKMIS